MRKQHQGEVDAREVPSLHPGGVQEGARRSLALLQTVSDNMPALLGYWNAELVNEYANSAYVEFFAVAADNIQGLHIRDVLGEELYEHVRPRIEQVLAGHRQDFEVVVRNRQGEPRILRVTYAPHSVDGHLRGFVVLAVDATQRRREMEQLAASEERYRMLAENSSDVVLLLEPDGVVSWSSPSVEAELGYGLDQVPGTDALGLVHPDDLKATVQRVREARAGAELVAWEARVRRAGGEYGWFALQARPHEVSGSAEPALIIGMRDVTEQVRARQSLERSERLLRAAMSGAPHGMAVISIEGRFLSVNKAMEALTGRTQGWLLQHDVTDLLLAHDSAVLDAAHHRLLHGSAGPAVVDHILARPDGSEVWVEQAITLVRDTAGQPLFLVAHLEDTTQRRAWRKGLEFRAHHDALTRLPNRQMALDTLDAALSRARGGDGVVAVLFCDLDRFKRINDSHGHRAGDEALRVVAERLQHSVRSNDVVARLGGDEFLVVLGEVGDAGDAVRVAEKMIDSVSTPIALGEYRVGVGMTVGVCIATAGTDSAKVLDAADAALYEAKRARRGSTKVNDLR